MPRNGEGRNDHVNSNNNNNRNENLNDINIAKWANRAVNAVNKQVADNISLHFAGALYAQIATDVVSDATRITSIALDTAAAYEQARERGHTMEGALIESAVVAGALYGTKTSLERSRAMMAIDKQLGEVFGKTFAGGVAKGVAKGTMIGHIASAVGEMPALSEQLRASGRSEINAALATTIGALAGMATSAMGCVAMASGAAEIATGVAAPLGAVSVASGAYLMYQSARVSYDVAQVTSDCIEKFADIHVAFWHSMKQTVNDFYRQYPEEKKDYQQFCQGKILQLQQAGAGQAELMIYGIALNHAFLQYIPGTKDNSSEGKDADTKNILNSLKDAKVYLEKENIPAKIQENISPLYGLSEKMDTTERETRLLVALLTDDDVSEFMNVEEIASYKRELDTLKQQEKISPEAIFSTMQKMRAVVLKEAEKRKMLEDTFSNLSYMTGIASNAAILFGKGTLAQQVSTIGSASLKIGHAVGMLANAVSHSAGNPYLAAGNLLMEACTQLVGLRQKGSNPHQVILCAIHNLSEQLHLFEENMHKRFDQVIQHIERQRWEAYLNDMKQQQATANLFEKLDILQDCVTQQGTEQKAVDATIGQALSGIEKMLKALTIRPVQEEVTMIVEIARRDDETTPYLPKIDALATANNKGAQHTTVTGESVIDTQWETFAKLMHDTGTWHFSLNTLNSFFEQKKLSGDYFLSAEEMAEIIKITPITEKYLTSGKNKPLFAEDIHCGVASFYQELKKAWSLNEKLFIPMNFDCLWEAVIIDKQENVVHYYQAAVPNFFRGKAIDILQMFLSDQGEKMRFQAHPFSLPTGFNKQGSSLVMLKIWEQWQGGVPIQQFDIDFPKTALAEGQYLTYCAKLKAPHFQMPSNPLLLAYLSYGLLLVLVKKYTNLSTPVAVKDVERLQRVIDQVVCTANAVQRIQNKDFFCQLVEKYQEATKRVCQILQEKWHKFYQNELREASLAYKTRYEKESFSGIQRFNNQEISIGVEYGGSFFVSEIYQTHRNKNKKDETGWQGKKPHNYTHREKIKFEQKQKTQIEGMKKTLSSEISARIDEVDWRRADLRMLPAQLTPSNPADPVLLMPTDCSAVLPDIFYIAQHAKVGSIQCDYALREMTEKTGTLKTYFVLSFYFVPNCLEENTERLLLKSLCVPYEPLFYTDKEAIWWFWHGGAFPKTTSDVHNTCVERGGNGGKVDWDYYVYLPVCQPSVGMRHQLITTWPTLRDLVTAEARAENERKVTQWTNREIEQPRWEKWQKSVRDTMATDTYSELGHAIKMFDSYHALLSKSMSSLPTSNQYLQSDVWKTFFGPTDFAVNSDALQYLMTRFGERECFSFFPTAEMFEKLGVLLAENIDRAQVHNQHTLIDLNGVLKYLLDYLDEIMPRAQLQKNEQINTDNKYKAAFEEMLFLMRLKERGISSIGGTPVDAYIGKSILNVLGETKEETTRSIDRAIDRAIDQQGLTLENGVGGITFFKTVKKAQTEWWHSDKIDALLKQQLKEIAYVLPYSTDTLDMSLLADNLAAAVAWIIQQGKPAVLPIHIHGNHWVGLVLKKEANQWRCIFNDPKGTSAEISDLPKKIMEVLTGILGAEPLTVLDLRCAQQKNDDDCGPFTVDNLITLASEDTQQLSLEQLRALLYRPANGRADLLREKYDAIKVDHAFSKGH